MTEQLRITRLTVHQYRWTLDDFGFDYNGFNQVYHAGSRAQLAGYVFTIETDAGITGEYAGGNSVSYAQVGMVAPYLLGNQLIKTPLLLGEHVRTLEPYVDVIVADGTDFVRADADYDGGITGVLTIAHAAEGFGLDCEIHAPGPAHRQCMAALRNTNYYELGLVHPRIRRKDAPIYQGDYSDELDAIDARGHVPVPRGPGLGVTIDWEWVKAHEVGLVEYR